LHQDNRPSDDARKAVLASKNIAVLAHPAYSPDFAPCDFFLFPKIKSMLKGTHFVSVEEVKAKMTELLNRVTENSLHHCFEQWQRRTQLCLNSQGDYFEGDHKSFFVLCK
jgi:hypothetical protein